MTEASVEAYPVMNPTVSILLPNLNNRRFLEERLDTILRQSLSDWELIIVDNHSEDGAWEFFQDLPRKDSRIDISQAPRDGMYVNWNNCIRKASGRYVYIATSDDTMAPDCLETLARALDLRADCDLAHCRLRMINEAGADAPDWWSKNSVFARSCPDSLDRQHIRRAPFDGLLHLGGTSVYVSITQLLIRRTLFDRIGMFSPRWGAMGDFNWNMRASLVASTVHVPDTWGGWRVHPGQATAQTGDRSTEYRQRIDEMIDDALGRSEESLPKKIRERLCPGWAEYAQDVRHFSWELDNWPAPLERKAFLLKRVLKGSRAARQHVMARLLNGSFGWGECGAQIVQKWLDTVGMGPGIASS